MIDSLRLLAPGDSQAVYSEEDWEKVADGSTLPPEDFFDTQEAPSQQGE